MSEPATPRPEVEPAAPVEPTAAVAPSEGLDAAMPLPVKKPDSCFTDRSLGRIFAGVYAVTIATAFGLGCYFALPQLGSEKWEQISAIVRNFGLVAVGLPALWLAWNRTRTATRQADISNRQAEIANDQARVANRQADLAEQGLIIDRYQKGAQMLENSELSVRIAGVYALRELALSHPEETYFLVLDILYAFVREKSKERKPKVAMLGESARNVEYGDLPADLHSSLAAASLVRQMPFGAALEARRDWRVHLWGANLSGAYLLGANLCGANLSKANLSNARLSEANLSGTHLKDANLSGADLKKADFSNAKLQKTDLSGADLKNAKMANAYLLQANLSGTDLSYAILTGARLTGTNLSGALLAETNWSGARFWETEFTDTSITGATLSNIDIFGSNLTGADLRGASLSNAKLCLTNLSGANFSSATIDSKTSFRQVWAFENNPPRSLPARPSNIVTYRRRDEAWSDFEKRLPRQRARP